MCICVKCGETEMESGTQTQMEMEMELKTESRGGKWAHAAFHIATTIATPAAYSPLPFALASLGWTTGLNLLTYNSLTHSLTHSPSLLLFPHPFSLHSCTPSFHSFTSNNTLTFLLTQLCTYSKKKKEKRKKMLLSFFFFG